MQQLQFEGDLLRRSSTTKNKPYVYDYPNCDRSYFYLHDVRRHEKQKHNDGGVTVVSVHRENDIEGIWPRQQGTGQTEPLGQSAQRPGTDSDIPTQQYRFDEWTDLRACYQYTCVTRHSGIVTLSHNL